MTGLFSLLLAVVAAQVGAAGQSSSDTTEASQLGRGGAALASGEIRDPFFAFYASNLRGSLFAGFLTLSGFLFSAKTFIIINMKKEVYEHQAYQKKIADMRKEKPDAKYYSSLQNLSTLLFFTVLSALFASVSQLTIGLYPSQWAAVACLFLAVVAVAFLTAALFVIRGNLKQLFQFLEEQADVASQDTCG